MKVEKINLTFTQVLVTADKELINEFGLVTSTEAVNTIKDIQTVVAVGPMVQEPTKSAVGKKAALNFINYLHTNMKTTVDKINEKMVLKLPIVEFEDAEGNTKEYMLLQDRDIKFIINE